MPRQPLSGPHYFLVMNNLIHHLFFRFAVVMFPIIILMTPPLHAGVNLKNGNFYISYTDLIAPLPEPGRIRGGVEIVRTYNSRATEMGWFGFGWGSDFETYLTFNGESGITVHENGSGALRNVLDSSRAAAGERAVDLYAKIHPIVPNTLPNNSLLLKWQMNYENRLAYTLWLQGREMEWPQHPPLHWKQNFELTCGNKNCKQDHGFTITRTQEGYSRQFSSGKSEYFDLKGRLIMIRERNGYFVRLEFDSTGTMRRMIDVNSYELHFEWTSDGKVRRIEDSMGRNASYDYQGPNLIRSEDTGGNVFLHEYDGTSNMTAVRYADGKALRISYSDKQFVTKVSSRDESIVHYEYGADPKDPDLHYWTIVKRQDSGGGLLSANRYEYQIAVNPDGTRYTKKIIVDKKSENLKEVTVYAPNGQTVTKDVNGEVTRYSYHPRYQVLDGELGPNKEVRYEFDSERQLIRTISETTSDSPVQRIVRFEYSQDREQMLSMTDSEGNTFQFIYDDRGQVRAIDSIAGQIVLNRNRFGSVLATGFEDGPILEFKADATVELYGFTLKGDADEAYRERLRDALHSLKKWTEQTYFPHIIPTS